MPWTGPQFAKHNHSLSPAQAAHASHIANHVLKSTGDEGEAIATANKLIKRDAGGAAPPPQQGGIGGSPTTANPMTASLIQRYSGLPTQQLQQMAAQMGGSPQGSVVNHLLMQRRMQPQGAPAQPAAPQAPVQAVKRGGGLDTGGNVDSSPWWTRSDARSDASNSPSVGFLQGPTSGRADAIDTTAPAGSHVIPADVVAGLGEGNSIAGAARMEQVIRTGPHGTSLPRGGGRSTIPRPPPAIRQQAKGGSVDTHEPENTAVKLSHGEYVVKPHDVLRWGKGDQKAGHDAWDKWIVDERKRQIKKLQSLPGPVKS